MNARNLSETKIELLDIIEKGWVDENTRYMAIVINFYDPIFKIMMYYAILYDKRFNFNSLSTIKSKSYLITYAPYENWELFLILYMAIGCILSILLVMVESFELVKGKLDKEEQYERLERDNQELVGIVEKKVLFFPLGKKSTLLFIKPNFFQFTSEP